MLEKHEFDVICGLINEKRVNIVYEMTNEDLAKATLNNLVIDNILELIGMYQDGNIDNEFIKNILKV